MEYSKELMLQTFKSMTPEEQDVIIRYTLKMMSIHLGTQEVIKILRKAKETNKEP